MELPERIATARQAAGLSQEKLGEAVGVSRQAVSKWELGQTRPDVDAVARLCQVLNLSADYLLFGKEGQVAAEVPPLLLNHLPCPKCGGDMTVGDARCTHCRYPIYPEDDKRYALLLTGVGTRREARPLLQECCKLSPAESDAVMDASFQSPWPLVLLRDLTRADGEWIASKLARCCALRIVADSTKESEDALKHASAALPCPPPDDAKAEEGNGLGFGGTVLAVVVGVVVALLIFSFF